MSLDTLLKLTLSGERVLMHEDKTPLGEQEVYAFVKELRAQGYTNFCGCDNIKPDGSCAGHPEKEESKV